MRRRWRLDHGVHVSWVIVLHIVVTHEEFVFPSADGEVGLTVSTTGSKSRKKKVNGWLKYGPSTPYVVEITYLINHR